jgi:hypothetical protein
MDMLSFPAADRREGATAGMIPYFPGAPKPECPGQKPPRRPIPLADDLDGAFCLRIAQRPGAAGAPQLGHGRAAYEAAAIADIGSGAAELRIAAESRIFQETAP